MELEKAKAIAMAVKAMLEPATERIEIAGSIRRQKSEVGDAELLAIPRYDGMVDLLDRQIQMLISQGILDYRKNKAGSRTYGVKNKLLTHVVTGFGVDIFTTTPDCWWVSLVVRTGGAESNKQVAMAAIRKGWHLKSYGSGFSTPDGEIVCHSEREVFEAVGLNYLPPEQRW